MYGSTNGLCNMFLSIHTHETTFMHMPQTGNCICINMSLFIIRLATEGIELNSTYHTQRRAYLNQCYFTAETADNTIERRLYCI